MIQAQSSCTAFWRGRERFFELALHEGFVHFWEPDSPQFREAPEEWIWVVQGSVRVGQNAVVNPRFLETAALSALKRAEVGRLIPLSKWHNVFLGTTGIGEICAPSPQCEGTPFRFESDDEFFVWAASAWRARIETWKSEDTDFGFALRWHDLSDDRKVRRLTLLSRGDWEEMERVAQLVLALECVGHLAKAVGGQTFAADVLSVQIRRAQDQFSWIFGEEFGDEFLPKRSQFEQLWRTWFGFFAPFPDYDVLERHAATSQELIGWLRLKFEKTASELSQHEQLETRLLLRDWLRERAHLSNERINELLA